MPCFATQLADGPGAPVVLSHALGLDHRMWAPWVATQRGRRPVLAYDHRGHGQSAQPSGALTMEDLVQDARHVVSEWQHGPVVFVGLSMGGMVGQGLAIRHPECVSHLVLAHTAAQYGDAAKEAWQQRVHAVAQGGMAAVADGVVQRYLTPAFQAAHPEATQSLRATLLQQSPQGYIANCHAVASVNWLDSLARIACPTLVLAGELDAGATPAMAQAIHQRIQGATMQVVPQASHLSPWEQPIAFNAAVEGLLRLADAGAR